MARQEIRSSEVSFVYWNQKCLLLVLLELRSEKERWVLQRRALWGPSLGKSYQSQGKPRLLCHFISQGQLEKRLVC